MQDWLIGFLTAIAVAIIGSFLSWYQSKLRQDDIRRAAVAALRFELESNLHWLDNIMETLNYLRDEAWVSMKNNGYISHLRKPIPRMIIELYDDIHSLNDRISKLRETRQNAGEESDDTDAITQKSELQDDINQLNAMLDKNYPEVGRNFRD